MHKRVAPLNFVVDSISRLASDLVTGLGEQEPISIHLCNAYTLALASESPDYMRLLNSSRSRLLVDGKPLLTMISFSHRGSKTRTQQTRGSDFMRSVLDLGQEGGLRHFLLGGSWHVLTRLEDAIKGQYPDAKVVGKYSPPFRVLSEYELLEQDRRIIDSGADVIWVGLGTPKQDFESRRLVETIGVSAIAVGAAFDFLSGVKSEAPIVIQRLYLEWLFRLLSEPRRLFKRYFWGNFKFIRLISTNKLAFQISNTFWPRGGTCDE